MKETDIGSLFDGRSHGLMQMKFRSKLFILLSLVLSCSQDKSEAVSKDFNMEIQGEYKYESFEWDGPDVDLNNDGIASNISAEYMLMSNSKAALTSNKSCRISSISEGYQRASISVDFPLQFLGRNVSDDSWFSGECGSNFLFLAYCKISRKGNLLITTNSSADPPLTANPYNDNNAAAWGFIITHLGEGRLQYTATCRVYDFKTGQFITGTVSASMVRTHTDWQ